MHGGYKTALCKNFLQHGNCSFGKQCNYAHGPMELRSTAAAGMMPPMSRSTHRPQIHDLPMHHSQMRDPPMHYSDPMPRRKEPDIYHPKYKTSLCASVINSTECTTGMLYIYLFFDFQVHDNSI